MKDELRLGFIGGGSNSAVGATHFISSRMDKRFSVVSGCFSRNAGVNAETAEKWGVDPDRVYSSVQALIEAEPGHLDALVVLTPTPSHLEIIRMCLEAGYPVIAEKALAMTGDQGYEIHRLKEKTGGFLAVTYNYTGYPMIRELHKLLGAGFIGAIRQVHVEMPQEGYVRRDREGRPVVPQQWRLEDGTIPTISLDLGVHLHQMIDFLTGSKPLEVSAMQSSKGAFSQVVDNVSVLARYSGDIDCSIWYSKSALGHRNGLKIRIYGETGSVEWVQMEPEQLVFSDSGGRKSIVDRGSADIGIASQIRYNRFKSGHPAGFMEAFANLYTDIADSLAAFRREGRQVEREFVFSSDIATEGLYMLEAVAEAARSGTWVAVGNGMSS